MGGVLLGWRSLYAACVEGYYESRVCDADVFDD